MKIATNTAKLLRNVPLPDEIGLVHNSAVILDMGSGTTRIGFSGDDTPRLLYPTVVTASMQDGDTTDVGPASHTAGNPIVSQGMSADASTSAGCFDMAYANREHQPVKPVLERGLVTDWDGVEKLLAHVDRMLLMSHSNNVSLLFPEAPLVPREQRERMAQILYETIGITSAYFPISSVLSMYASGRTTGLALDLGYGSCYSVPAYEGFAMHHAITQLQFGGNDLTTYVGDLLMPEGYGFPPHHQRDIWQFVKETCAEVAPTKEAYLQRMRGPQAGDVVQRALPDGTVVSLGTNRFTITEAFFDPGVLAGQSAAVDAFLGGNPMNGGQGGGQPRGMASIALESIRRCDQDIAPLLYSNLVYAGGSSLFRGLPDRITSDVEHVVSREMVRMFAPTERHNATFIGGSILASLPTFQDIWVTKEDYDEYGPCVAVRNCL